MINKWYFTGDCHGDFSRFDDYDTGMKQDSNIGIIILGDAGFNFWLDKRDNYNKDKITESFAFTVYCVRGNHEARPVDVPGMIHEYDINVRGYVWYQPNWPRVKYFDDYGIYTIYTDHYYYTLGVIGGAYSVDKYYRIQRKIPWFENEQLDHGEMDECLELFENKNIDIMLTHTCPIDWEPRDLFLPQINQSSVDKKMELFFEELKDKFYWKVWLFGHYHDDRLVRPYVEMLYKTTEDLRSIWKRWDRFFADNSLDFFMRKDPMFWS